MRPKLVAGLPPTPRVGFLAGAIGLAIVVVVLPFVGPYLLSMGLDEIANPRRRRQA